MALCAVIAVPTDALGQNLALKARLCSTPTQVEGQHAISREFAGEKNIPWLQTTNKMKTEKRGEKNAWR